MNQKIIIGIIIFFIIIILYKSSENFESSSEAVQNIASIYADTNKLATFNNINVVRWRGMITMWSGTIETIPPGWALCDGSNNTPDLRGRFVLGLGQGSGLTNRNLNDIGGTETHQLTINEMPSHNHETNPQFLAANGCGPGREPYGGLDGNRGLWHQSCPLPLNSQGGNAPHNNMPPYYVLAYIMKV